MSLEKNSKITPFLTFDRTQWAALRKSVPLKLTEQDLKPLLGFNEDLSLEEVRTIYLPLARLINYYIEENLKRQKCLTLLVLLGAFRSAKAPPHVFYKLYFPTIQGQEKWI